MSWLDDLQGITEVQADGVPLPVRAVLNFSGARVVDNAAEGRTDVTYWTIATDIVASTTQTQGQQPLTADLNIVTVCDNVDDTVTLPNGSDTALVFIYNKGDEVLQVFPDTGAEIDGSGTNASIGVDPDGYVLLLAVSSTSWRTILSTGS